jgi:hypothetical protein
MKATESGQRRVLFATCPGPFNSPRGSLNSKLRVEHWRLFGAVMAYNLSVMDFILLPGNFCKN